MKVYYYSMWNYFRKLFIMLETFHNDLANEFVKAFEESGSVEVCNSC